VTVTVTPERFVMVHFDHDVIEEIAVGVATAIGFDVSSAGPELIVAVNEQSPMNSVVLSSLEPITVSVTSGAFENPKRIRHLDPAACRESVGRGLIEASDRASAAFGAPAFGAELPVTHVTAWATNSLGRLARLGGRQQMQRRRYQFRVHHGFSDVADAAFDRLWNSDELTFAEIIHWSNACRTSHPPGVISS